MRNKNWFGLVEHPSDQLIHWSETNEDALQMAEQLRHAWDNVTCGGRGVHDDLQFIVEAAQRVGFLSAGA